MNRNIVIEDGNLFRFLCPHCNFDIEVLKNQTKCCIFRCGIYKNNYRQIPPHTNKQECDRLVRENLINGCSRPFRFIYGNDGQNYVEPCGYI